MKLCDIDGCRYPKLSAIVAGRRRTSNYCYWHRLLRTSMVDQVKEATKRRETAAGALSPVADDERWCPGCTTAIPTFYMNGARCKACASSRRHEASVASTYGLAPGDYERLLALQQGRCAICRRRPRAKRLAVDHNHGTGKVRGLLCEPCNRRVLGGGHDSLQILRNAVYYLEHPPYDGEWTPPGRM